MPEWFILIVAVVIFYLLWLAIDYFVSLLPKSKDAPPLPLAAVLKLLLLIGAVVWLVARYLGGRLF